MTQNAFPSSTSAAKHMLISGAGSGIGRALCLAYAAPGLRLSLWGRDRQRLEETAERCAALGAECGIISQDIRDLEASRGLLRELQARLPVDTAFLNAGATSGTLPDGRPEPVEHACRTLEVNAVGTINMAATLLEGMRERGGHLILVSSLAFIYPFADCPTYCASKAALAVYGKALRQRFPNGPVRVSVVYPGYVDSPMSDRIQGSQPLRWSAERAAAHIRARLEAGSDSIAFPRLLALGSLAMHLLPGPLARRIARSLSFNVIPENR